MLSSFLLNEKDSSIVKTSSNLDIPIENNHNPIVPKTKILESVKASSSYLDFTSILSGVICTCIMLILIFVFFRPWIHISKRISNEGNGICKFKLINYTPVQCADVSIFLRKVTEKDAFPKGKDVQFKLLPMNSQAFMYVEGAITGFFKNHKPNCIQLKYDNNLIDDEGNKNENIVDIVAKDGEYIEFIVKARHGMSNLQSTKTRRFKHSKWIVNGKFKSGFTTKIIS